MDDRATYVHDSPLFSPNFRVRCRDAKAERRESNKNTPKNTPKKTPKKTPKHPEKNASSIEVEIESSSNLSQISGMTRDSNLDGGRPSRHHSIIEDDKEWEGLDELRMKVRRFIEEQKEENKEIYGTEKADSMSYSGTPVIIQAGGVASYHPLYSPSAPRPRFLKYGASSPEFYTHRHTPADIQRSETNSKASTEANTGAELGVEKEADQGHNEELEVITQCPELAQYLPSLEDAEQPHQRSAEPDDTAEPKPNCLLTQNIDRSTVGFKNSRRVTSIRKKMLPLLMLLILTTAAFGIGLLDDNYFGARVEQYHCNHTKPLPLTERENISQKVKGFFLLLWKPVHSEYMGQMKNSTCAFVGRLTHYLYHCPCSSFSCPKSYYGFMIGKNWTKIFRRLMGTFSSFYQDMLLRMSSGAGEIQEFCKCQPINISCPVDSIMGKNATVDIEQASKDETNQRIQDNSFTYPIQEPTRYTLDVNHVHPEYNDQYFEQDSFTNAIEEDESQCTQCSFLEVSEPERVNAPGEQAFKSGMVWKLVALAAILLLLIAGAKHYLKWRKAQKMVEPPRQRSNRRQRRQQIEQTVTSPLLGSFLQHPEEVHFL